MKPFLLFFILLAINLPANASVEHTCVPEKSHSDISKITLSYVNSDYTLSIFHNLRSDEEVKVEYYDDITYIGFNSDTPQYDLLFSDQNSDAIWTNATLSYGNNFEQRLELLCH